MSVRTTPRTKRSMCSAFAILMVLALGVPANATEAPTDSRAPRPNEVTSSTDGASSDIPIGANVGVWGQDDRGNRFSYTYTQTANSPPRGPTLSNPLVPEAVEQARAQQPAPNDVDSDGQPPTPTEPAVFPEATATASWSCTAYISDVYIYYNGDFRWRTNQFCSGTFGYQRHRTQLWRSSWSGPRGYTYWWYTPWTRDSDQPRTWNARCGSGGTYTYHPVVQGEATYGNGPILRSNNELIRSCGTGIS